MTSKASTPDQYINELPEDRKEGVSKLRNTIAENLPKGFKEVIGYGMLGNVVPMSYILPAIIALPNCPCHL